MDVETVALGIAVLTPVYSMMWKIMSSLEILKVHYADCPYCQQKRKPYVTV